MNKKEIQKNINISTIGTIIYTIICSFFPEPLNAILLILISIIYIWYNVLMYKKYIKNGKKKDKL